MAIGSSYAAVSPRAAAWSAFAVTLSFGSYSLEQDHWITEFEVFSKFLVVLSVVEGGRPYLGRDSTRDTTGDVSFETPPETTLELICTASDYLDATTTIEMSRRASKPPIAPIGCARPVIRSTR